MQPNNAGSVSAVPSGSAGEPTPTTVAAALAANDAAILSALTGMSSTRVTVDEQGRRFQAVRDTRDALLSAVAAAATAQTTDVWAEVDALRAEFATLKATEAEIRAAGFDDGWWGGWGDGIEEAAQEADRMGWPGVARCIRELRKFRVRALAGGAPPATQTTDTTEE